MSSYINGLLMAVLRPALAARPDMDSTQVGTKLPEDYTEHLPFVLARETPGGSNRGPQRATRFGVPIQIDVYADESREAHDVADEAMAALDLAWQTQTVLADGHIGRLANVVGPFEFPEPDRLDGVARWVMTATLTARPPAA